MTESAHEDHIAIVGAGILGLSHAVAALDAGYRVTVVEQDSAAVLASVRNFGHIGATAHEGELGILARESLPLWKLFAERADLDVRRSGTLVVAESAAEDAVVQEFLATGGPTAARALTGTETTDMLGTAATLASGILLPNDLTADPRTTVARLAAWVDAHERGEVRFRTAVTGVDTGVLRTSRGSILADDIIVTAGHLVGRLFPQLAEEGEVRECALQVMRVRAPYDMGIGPAVLTGTSMLRYSAFAGAAADALRADLGLRRPELFEIDANVMLTQQSDGTLIVGDSHKTHDAAPPFLDERWSNVLLNEVARLLGVPDLDVIERWQGIYATSTKQDVLQVNPMPGVTVTTVTTGLGMTIGPALAARTIARLAESRRPSLQAEARSVPGGF